MCLEAYVLILLVFGINCGNIDNYLSRDCRNHIECRIHKLKSGEHFDKTDLAGFPYLRLFRFDSSLDHDTISAINPDLKLKKFLTSDGIWIKNYTTKRFDKFNDIRSNDNDIISEPSLQLCLKAFCEQQAATGHLLNCNFTDVGNLELNSISSTCSKQIKYIKLSGGKLENFHFPAKHLENVVGIDVRKTTNKMATAEDFENFPNLAFLIISSNFKHAEDIFKLNENLEEIESSEFYYWRQDEHFLEKYDKVNDCLWLINLRNESKQLVTCLRIDHFNFEENYDFMADTYQTMFIIYLSTIATAIGAYVIILAIFLFRTLEIKFQ